MKKNNPEEERDGPGREGGIDLILAPEKVKPKLPGIYKVLI